MSKQLKTVKKKKQTIITNKKYVNEATGEVEDFVVIQKNVYQDFNFHKIWLQDLMNILDTFGSKKIKVLSHLLSKMRNEDNTISTTYRQIAKDTGISYQTVAVTIKELLNSNVLKRLNVATYQFNPDIIVKGNSKKRHKLLIEYNTIEAEEIEDIEIIEEREKKKLSKRDLQFLEQLD